MSTLRNLKTEEWIIVNIEIPKVSEIKCALSQPKEATKEKE